jgi:hypothetical protein
VEHAPRRRRRLGVQRTEEPSFSYDGAYRPLNSKLAGRFQLRYSGIETLRFYGFGNETNDNGPDKFFRVRNEEFFTAPGVTLPLWRERIRVSAGPFLLHSRTKKGNRLIDQLDPYGAGEFNIVGAEAIVRFDTRRTVPEASHGVELSLNDENPAAGYPVSGVLVDVRGTLSPELWDVESTWGSVRGSVSGYASVLEGSRITFAARAGGEHVFGTFRNLGQAFSREN